MKSNSSKQYNGEFESVSSHVDHSPFSPQTRAHHLPINSYKSLISGSPNTQKQQPTRLNDFMEPQSAKLNSKTIILASSNQGTLHFHDQAASVFQRYPSNDVNFVGVWGSQNCDKGFFLDRILNLCDVEGDKYTELDFQNGSQAELFFYERPFIKDKIRFFFIDSKGYKDPRNLTKSQKNQLDILLSICQVIVIMQDLSNNDIVDIAFTHFNDSFNRLYIDRKKKQEQPSEICWPNSLFVLYATPDSIKKHRKPESQQQELCRMFKDYSFSILHNKNACSEKEVKTFTTIVEPLQQLYLKNASTIFLEIYSKLEKKEYLNIKYNGLTVPHIMAEIVYTLNQHENLYLPRAFNKAKRSVFSSLYNRHALSYLLKMKQYISEQKPYSTDYLLEAFQDVSQQTLAEYNETQNDICIRPSQDSLCIEYEKKMDDYIQEKQKNILAVNSKKSAKQLKNLQPGNPKEELKKVQKSVIGQAKRSFDHKAQSVFVGNQIKSLYLANMQAPQIKPNVVPQQIEVEQDFEQQINQKKLLLSKRKVELESLSAMQVKNAQEFSKGMKQVERLKQQQRELELKIKSEAEALVQLKQKHVSRLQSNFGSGASDQFLLDGARAEVDELKQVLKSKLNQKNRFEQAANVEMEPEAQALQSKLIAKREEVQQVKKSNLRNVGESSVSGAERRIISAKQANIRRIPNSKT